MKGFTLIEVLLSMTIIGMVAGLSLPVYAAYANRTTLDTTAQSVAELYRRAATYARSGNSDNQWSVEAQAGAVTLFKGAIFNSRDTSYDEAVTLSGDMTATGLSEVIFDKLTANPSATGTLTLTANNETRMITLNAKGMVSY